MRLPRATALLAFFALLATSRPAPLRADSGTQEELLRGVRAFRAERYEEALITFRLLQGGRSVPEIGFYMGITLHKLNRHREALVAFRGARRAGLREPVGEYYQALSCYRLGLLARARQGFASLLSPTPGAPDAGPRLREGAGRFVQRIDGMLAGQPAAGRFEAALAAAEGAPAGEAAEWMEEAALLLPQQPARASAAARLRQAIARLPLPPAEAAELSRSAGL